MAAPHSAAAAAGRPAGGLRLGSVDLADGRQSDADLRPAAAGPGGLRRDHPRQPGSGPPGSRATGLRPGGDEENTGRVSHASDSGRRASKPAHQLQNFDLKQYFKEGRGCRTEGTFRNPNDFGINKGLANLPYLQKIGRRINRRLLEVERVSHNSELSGDSIQRVVQPTVNEDGQKSPGLKFGQPRVMALFLALTLFHHLIDGFRNSDLRQHIADLLGVDGAEYTSNQMTYDLRRLRLKGLIYRPPGTHRYFATPYGWKVARLFSRLDACVFRPAMAMFSGNDAVLPFPLRQALNRTDAQLDTLIYQAFPLAEAG